MANSKVGQYRLEFALTGYTAPVREHVTGLWVAPTTAPAPGALPADIDLQLLGGGTKTLQEVADQFSGFLRRFYDTAIAVETFTMWRYVTEFSRDFVSSGTAVPGVPGTGTTQVAHQKTLTFRHANGGIGKVVFLESRLGGNDRDSLVANPVGTDTERMASYLMSVDSPMLALDNSFPVAPLRNSNGENERVFRKVFRG